MEESRVLAEEEGGRAGGRAGRRIRRERAESKQKFAFF